MRMIPQLILRRPSPEHDFYLVLISNVKLHKMNNSMDFTTILTPRPGYVQARQRGAFGGWVRALIIIGTLICRIVGRSKTANGLQFGAMAIKSHKVWTT